MASGSHKWMHTLAGVEKGGGGNLRITGRTRNKTGSGTIGTSTVVIFFG